MEQEIKKRVAEAMTEALDAEVKEEWVIKLPSDGTMNHMGIGPWDVYCARTGEFVLVAYVYDDEEDIDVEII